MFHQTDSSSIVFERVASMRLKSPYVSEVVTRHFLDMHDFGAGFFQKVLGKSILKPGSIQAVDKA